MLPSSFLWRFLTQTTTTTTLAMMMITSNTTETVISIFSSTDRPPYDSSVCTTQIWAVSEKTCATKLIFLALTLPKMLAAIKHIAAEIFIFRKPTHHCIVARHIWPIFLNSFTDRFSSKFLKKNSNSIFHHISNVSPHYLAKLNVQK